MPVRRQSSARRSQTVSIAIQGGLARQDCHSHQQHMSFITKMPFNLKLRDGIIPFIKNFNENVDFNLCFHSDDYYFLESVLKNYIRDRRQSSPDFDDRTSILDKLEHYEKVCS